MAYSDDILKAASLDIPYGKLNGKNILVVGATGLIGSCLVKVLMATGTDCNVYASGRNRKRAERIFAEYSDDARFHFLEYDVTKPLQSDVTFHYIIDAASGANPIAFSTDPVGVMTANFLGVNNLLAYGVQHGMERFVYVSSGEVYGEGDGREFSEDYSGYVNPMSPRSCYPSSKRAAETLCASYAQQYGVECLVARPCHVYGPGFTESDTRVYAQFIRNVLRGEDIVMKSTGEQFRSWCYDVDCATALLYILLKGESGLAYNIADNNSNISIRELAEMTASIGGTKVRIELPSDIEKRGFNPVTKSVFSNQRLMDLGWKPLHSMRESLENTINQLK